MHKQTLDSVRPFLLQAAVFKTEGAIGVGLVNAVRGAVITAVVAALFCGPERRHLCLTNQTMLSAAVTTVGGAVYVLAGGVRQPPKPKAAAERHAARMEGAAAAEQEDKASGNTEAAGVQPPGVVGKDKDA